VHAGERRIHCGLAADSGDQWTWFFFFKRYGGAVIFLG
jgi:hypothetical protein